MMEARETIKNNIDYLFKEAPKTRAVLELKEELFSNAMERYDDLLESGTVAEDAIQMVISSIGDVNELVGSIEPPKEMQVASESERKKSALLISVSVGFYIFAGLVLIAEHFLLGVALTILPTCLLVYNAYAYPRYKSGKNTVVEEFKEWNQNNKSRNGLRVAISGVIWTFAIVIFFLLGFNFAAWHVAWMIFLVALCAEAIVLLVFKIKELY